MNFGQKLAKEEELHRKKMIELEQAKQAFLKKQIETELKNMDPSNFHLLNQEVKEAEESTGGKQMTK